MKTRGRSSAWWTRPTRKRLPPFTGMTSASWRTRFSRLKKSLNSEGPPCRRRGLAGTGKSSSSISGKTVNPSEEFLGQRHDDARGASHVAESVHVLVLGHLADEL